MQMSKRRLVALEMADVYKIVYREFKHAGGGGADGSAVGMNGSVSARCVEVILQWMELHGSCRWENSLRSWLWSRVDLECFSCVPEWRVHAE